MLVNASVTMKNLIVFKVCVAYRMNCEIVSSKQKVASCGSESGSSSREFGDNTHPKE